MAKIYEIDNPALVDRLIVDLQKSLAAIPWLDYVFGRAQRLVRYDKRREYFYPAVYVGDSEYKSVLPNDMIGNFAWFDIPDYERTERSQRHYGRIRGQMRIVFWFDEAKIFGLGQSNKERLKKDVLDALRVAMTQGGRLYVNRIGERNENIYLGYSIREIDTQHLIYPHGGFVVEGEYTIGEECGPSPKPIYINTTGGTISPETVLKGYVGFSNGERVVGSLDISEAVEQAIDVGRNEVIDGQRDATIHQDNITAGLVGYGVGNERIIGTAKLFEPELWPKVVDDRTKVQLLVTKGTVKKLFARIYNDQGCSIRFFLDGSLYKEYTPSNVAINCEFDLEIGLHEIEMETDKVGYVLLGNGTRQFISDPDFSVADQPILCVTKFKAGEMTKFSTGGGMRRAYGCEYFIFPKGWSEFSNTSMSDNYQPYSCFLLCDTVPIFDTNTFRQLNMRTVFYIRDDMYEAYLADTAWSAYADNLLKLSEFKDPYFIPNL